MKKTMMSTSAVRPLPGGLRFGMLGLTAAFALVSFAAVADEVESRTYAQVNLVSDIAGLAQLQDTNLLNPWGISFNSSSPFWVSDNGAGLATLYSVTNDSGGGAHVSKVGLQVTIPGDGVPTGQLFNGTGAFHNDMFIFAGEDGTISGWRGALGSAAELLVSRTNAVYKGVTLDTNTGTPLLVLANFREGSVDVYDTNLVLTQLWDMNAPEGYAPFNVYNLNGLIVVTFAKQDVFKHDDVAGRGHGLIDILDLKTGKFHRFATGSGAGGHLKDFSSPWGVALAPKGFAGNDERLLVGNFGSGTIMTFEADGKFTGLLRNIHHHPVKIDGLWGLVFGNGGRGGVATTLYFSAGLNGESDGLFGSLTLNPKPTNDNDADDDGDNDDD